MKLETREFASFAVLAEQLHFARAAARLHVSQPALSKRIRNLEEKIGGPLLVRNRRGVALTAAGAMFYKDCAGSSATSILHLRRRGEPVAVNWASCAWASASRLSTVWCRALCSNSARAVRA